MLLKRGNGIGIGGWLLLPFVGIHIALVMNVYDTINFIITLSSGVWGIFTDPASRLFSPIIALFFAMQISLNFILAGWALALLYLFYRQSKYVPRTAIYYYLASVLVVAFDFGAVVFVLADIYPVVKDEAIVHVVNEFVLSVLAACVWVPYFMYSNRVKDTFTGG